MLLLHVFVAPFPGAQFAGSRGSRRSPLDKLNDALLVRGNTAALFCGFIRDVDGTSGFAAVPLPMMG
jgi:hypothetical protein